MWRRVASTPDKTPMMGPGHLRLNRAKRSVVFDLKSETGKKAVHQLIARSDVFIHNIRTDAIKRPGLHYQAAKAIRLSAAAHGGQSRGVVLSLRSAGRAFPSRKNRGGSAR